MSEFAVRSSLSGLEEYEVETIDAEIIVNANESNYPVPDAIQTEIEDLLSEKVLDGTVSENASIHITVGEDKKLKLVVRKTGRKKTVK